MYIAIGAIFGCVIGVVCMFVLLQTTALPAALDLPIPTPTPKPLPLLAYTIPALQEFDFAPSQLQAGESLEETPNYLGYAFTYQTTGSQMSGRITLPTERAAQPEVVVMLRGYVPAEGYVSGAGTNPAARVFAKNGMITVAPDFLGYGDSDAEPANEWQARFQKPVQVVELIDSLLKYGVPLPDGTTIPVTRSQLRLWAHSNGGQIALTALELLQDPIPTTLWAPASAPFPYSILYFGDETDDEGQQQRKWISLFEKDYDARQFSFTDYLNLLPAGLKLQIHQGLQDDAIHYTWNDELVDKLAVENEVRQASDASELDVTYYRYPGTDHNMRPSWDTVVARDLDFLK